jgi:hypothetical protein
MSLLVRSLMPRELPIWRFVIGAAVLDQPHCGKDAAVEGTANGGPLLIDGATLRSQMNAGSIRAPLKHQLAIRAPLRP